MPSQQHVFDIESKAGLSGYDTMASFECLLAEETFYVQLGVTPFALFDKSTYLNLLDFAESQSAKQCVLLLAREHPERREYERTFRVIEAIRVKATSLPVRQDDARVTSLCFYKVTL